VAVAPIATVVAWDRSGQRRGPRRAPRASAGAAGPEAPDVHAELKARAGSQGSLRRALAALAGRFVALRAWERLGFVRLRDYARERLGLSERQLQDLAAVDAALRALPALESALVAGTIPWTKARLLARVATRETERRWLARAATMTASDLEHEVRRIDTGSLEGGALGGGEDDPEAWPRETVSIRCTPAVRARWWHVRQLANRVAGESLPPAACAEAVAAEVLSALPTRLPDADRPLQWEGAPPGPPPPGRVLRRQRRWHRVLENARGDDALKDGKDEALRSPLPHPLRGWVDGLAEADPFTLDRRLRRAVSLEQRLEAQLGPLLRAVAEGHGYATLGFRRFDAYVRAHLGMAPRRAQALVRLERAADRVPALRRAYREGSLSWVKAHALIPVLVLGASPEAGARWVAWAGRVSVRRLEADVGRALVLHATDPAAWGATAGLPGDARPATTTAAGAATTSSPLPETPEVARSQLRADSMHPEQTARLFFTAPREIARLVRAVLCTVRRRAGPLTREGEAFGWMLDHAIAVWSVDARGRTRVRREHRVFERDGWRCTVPGCSSYRNLHDHHIVFRSRGGSHALANRTTLCAAHHLRGVHAGRVRCTGEAPGDLRFELGVRPGQPALLRYEPGERLAVADESAPV
jgi:hypothetical protein